MAHTCLCLLLYPGKRFCPVYLVYFAPGVDLTKLSHLSLPNHPHGSRKDNHSSRLPGPDCKLPSISYIVYSSTTTIPKIYRNKVSVECKNYRATWCRAA